MKKFKIHPCDYEVIERQRVIGSKKYTFRLHHFKRPSPSKTWLWWCEVYYWDTATQQNVWTHDISIDYNGPVSVRGK